MTALLDEICTNRLKDGDSFYRDGNSLDRRPISRGMISPIARNTIADHIKASVNMTHLANATTDLSLMSHPISLLLLTAIVVVVV